MIRFSWLNFLCITLGLWNCETLGSQAFAQTNLLQGKWINATIEDLNLDGGQYFIEINGSIFSYNTEEISDKGSKPILISQNIVEVRMAMGSDKSGMLFTQDNAGTMYLYTFTKLSPQALVFNDLKLSATSIGELMEAYEKITLEGKQQWAAQYPNEPFPISYLETGLLFHGESFYKTNQTLPVVNIDTPEACVAWLEKVGNQLPAQTKDFTRLGGFFMYLFYSQIIIEAGLANQVNPYNLLQTLNKAVDRYRDQGNPAVLEALKVFQQKLTGK